MATYPTGIPAFSARTDGTDPVIAQDINAPYTEITAIATTLGITPSKPTWTGTFNTSSTDFVTVTSRIANIETGVKEAYNNRVKTAGGSTIASTSTTVGLTISTSGTGNLLVAGNTTINSSGYIAVIDGGTA